MTHNRSKVIAMKMAVVDLTRHGYIALPFVSKVQRIAA